MADINIKDIARLAGVGVSTVSRVINNHPDVNKATKAHVISVIRKQHYVPNNSARNLKRSQSNTIGVLIKGITNPFFSRMIKVIEKEITRYKYTMVLHNVETDVDEIDAAIELSMEKKLRGIIFLGGCFNHTPEKLSALKVPFVLTTITTLSDDSSRELFSSVSIDDFKEAYKAVDYICKAGHKKIAILAAEVNDESIGWLRLEGYKAALRDNGIEPDPKLTAFNDEFSLSCGFNSTKQLLKGDGFTCIFCISDLLAMGSAKAILTEGKRIPQDISVVGFDGQQMAQFYSPSIMTVYQPDEEMALCSVQTLMDMLEHDGKHRHLLFEGKLMEGESFCKLSK